MNKYKFLINNKMNLTFLIVASALAISSIIYLTKIDNNNNSGRGAVKSYREYGFLQK